MPTDKARILVVDDREQNLILLESILIPEKYSVVKALDGFQALKILEEQNIDMVLLDVMMPKLSGFDVLKKIREDEKIKTIPVVLITALEAREDRIKGIQSGADDFISKPFDQGELIARVNTQINLSFLRRQLNEKEKLLRVMKLMNDGVIITNKDFTPMNINVKAQELLEIKETTHNLLEHLKNKFNGDMLDNANSGIINRTETEVHNPLYLSVVIQEIKDPHGEVESYVFMFRNITQEYLENRLRYDFLSLISHKLNTPLTVIGSELKFLLSIIKEEKINDIIKGVRNNQLRLENLITRLLYFVKIEKMDLRKKEPARVLSDILEKSKKIYNKPYQLNSKISRQEICFWEKIVLAELLDNSFKFHSEGEVVINLNVDDKIIELSDNGHGIPPEEKEKVLEPFYQIDKYSTGKIPGAGLGLTIVKKLVELHRGEFEFENNTGGGTVWKIKE